MKNKQTVATGVEGQTGNSTQAKRTTSFTGGGSYDIKVEAHLDAHWSEWLGGLAINHDNEGNTLLTGVIPDQAALHGILVKIRDLGLTLISLNRMEVCSIQRGERFCKKEHEGEKSGHLNRYRMI